MYSAQNSYHDTTAAAPRLSSGLSISNRGRFKAEIGKRRFNYKKRGNYDDQLKLNWKASANIQIHIYLAVHKAVVN